VKNKSKRLLAIREIINSAKISSQEKLLSELNNKGFDLTQATLSRDLKFLQVAKVPEKGYGYIYVLPESARYQESNGITVPPVNGYRSLEFSNNLAVLNTYPGYANSVAIAIDNLEAFEILGTIAGDDTILIIPREGISRNNVKKALARIIPELE